MKNRLISSKGNKLRAARFLALLAFCALFFSHTFAQTETAGGTQITNQASATYSDGSGNNYSTVSNTVTVTVANVSGLKITPDAGTRAAIVPGQQNVLYTFRVTNTGNFSDQVRFLANGQSIQLSGAATLAAAVIDVDGSGTINGGDTNILTNSSDVISALIAQNGYIDVIVTVNVNSNASPSSTISVQLGDTTTNSPTFDNQAANNSAREVRTVSSSSVNGVREARGDVSATVDTDAQLRLNLTAPTGPVALGSTISYGWEVCNTGLRAVQSITLPNAPAGSNTGVFIIAPVPIGTSLAAGQTFPAGTLYSTSPLTTTPLNAVYTTTAPSDLSTVRRVVFNVGATLAVGACSATIPMQVTITTTDATLDIYEIGDTFGTTTVGSQITDQSGDTVSNAGDGNANFNEGNQPGNVDGNGIQQITTLTRSGSVLIGPLNNANAVGPTSNNDDYTNRSISVPGIEAGGATVSASSLVFTNTIQNTGNSNDTFTLSLQSAPAGFTVEISLDGGTNYTTVTTNTLNLPLSYGASVNILVRVTVPAGSTVLQAGGFPVVIRSTSTLTPSAYNETIDRFYTGVFRMVKSATVINGTGVGSPTDAVPGADIEYTINYTNISSTGGTGNSQITISNIVITEDGNAAPNNWGTSTTHVASPAPSDSRGGSIVLSNSDTKLVDTVPTLAPQTSGTFVFRRRIK
ncbi:MAG TPA: hypothetical protein VF596_00475 [Pyrinomonadaceae bacterium]|jgi:hypothetical protein